METMKNNFIEMIDKAVREEKTVMLSLQIGGNYVNSFIKVSRCIVDEESIYITGDRDEEINIKLCNINTIEYDDEEEEYVINTENGVFYFEMVL